MGISEKLTYLNETKDLIKQAIVNKGVEVKDTDTFRSYANKISTIENTGGEKVTLQEKSVIPTTTQQEVVADEGYTGLAKVTVEKITGENLNVVPSSQQQNFNGVYTNVTVAGDENLIAENIKEGTSIFGVEGSLKASTSSAKITDARYLFYNGARTDYLSDLLSMCDNVTNATYMFYQCSKITKLDLSSFDTSKITNMNSMFYGCTLLTSILELDTASCTDTEYLFSSCRALTEVPELNTNKVTTMNYMFNNCANLISIPKINADKVKSALSILGYCTKLENFGGLENLGKGYTQKTKNYSNYKLDLSTCTALTHDSLMNVINNLYDLNLTYNVANGGTLYTQQLVLGSTNMAKLTAEEIAIATNKGWTILQATS